MSLTQEITILLIEDDPGHARLIEKNLRRAHLSNDILNFRDGRKALDFLLSDDSSAHLSLLVLLDLNLIGMDGYQVLKQMKAHERTKHIPVIILTTTDDSREVSKCYDLGCNIYITKPIEYEQFAQAIRQLGLFLSVVTLPITE